MDPSLSSAERLENLFLKKNTDSVNSGYVGRCLDVLLRGRGQGRVSVNPASPIYQLCEVGQVTEPLCASHSPSVKQ